MTAAFPIMLIGAAIASFSVADSAPKLDVTAGCKAAARVNAALNLSEAQSYDSCMREEASARNELEQHWASYPPVARERCMAVTAQHAPSYVEALVCIRLVQDPNSKDALEKFKKLNQ